ncbi:hypothetical protein VTI74DRAFT_5000 [Chaetomium olivicolor]
METYLLPSSPALKVLDRFSLLDEDPAIEEDPSGLVPLWPLLQTLLSPNDTNRDHPITSFAALASLLDTISITLRGTAQPAGDHALLQEAIRSHVHVHGGGIAGDGSGEQAFFARLWPRLVELALQMPVLFPAGALPVLGRGGVDTLVLSRKQAACLVVHQFLRTLVAPEWKSEEEGLHDFGLWYGREGQRQESAVKGYLAALMRYFEQVVCSHEGWLDGDWNVEYTLRSVREEEFRGLLDGEGCPLVEVEVEVVERYDLSPESLGMPSGAVVVAANRYIGFGKSATQEEVHVGTSPEACPAVLVTPPLRDDQVLVIRGAQAMLNMTGQRRDVRVEDMPFPGGGEGAWRQRTMLFMDALELDMVEPGDSLPDLRPENLVREIRKAYTAFSSGRFPVVRTGLWGCGAFCADPGIKMLLMWLAASLADTKLVVVCDNTGQEFAEQFRFAIEMAGHVLQSTANLRQLLNQAPRHLVRGQTVSWVTEQLGGE